MRSYNDRYLLGVTQAPLPRISVAVRTAIVDGPSNLALAGGIVLLIVLVNRFTSGFVAQLGVLLGLVVGTLVAVPMGLTDFSPAKGADWSGLTAPFHFGAPLFPIAAVISMCGVMLVTFTESKADMLAVGEMTGHPLSRADLARGLAGDSVSGIFAGVMNGFVDTVFAQNVGLVGMTMLRSRSVAAVVGGIGVDGCAGGLPASIWEFAGVAVEAVGSADAPSTGC